MRHALSFSAAALTFGLSSVALAADPKSWTAAVAHSPDTTAVVATLNTKSLRSQATYQQSVTQALNNNAEAKKAVEQVKTTCNIDLTTAVDDITVAAEDSKKVALFLHAPTVDEAKLTKCVKDAVKASAKGSTATFSSSKVGNVIEFTRSDKTEKLYLGVVDGVFVITDDPTNKARLEAAIGGKGALSKAKTFTAWVAKVATSSLFYAVAHKDMRVGKDTLKGGFAQASMSGSTLPIKATLEFADTTSATRMATDVTKLQADVTKKLPKAGKSLKASSSGTQATMEVTLDEAELKAFKP